MTEVVNFNDSRIARGLPPVESDVRVLFAVEIARKQAQPFCQFIDALTGGDQHGSSD